ncbi:hypothetical protein WA158_000447 [Blastocystis sp. Blastoise]
MKKQYYNSNNSHVGTIKSRRFYNHPAFKYVLIAAAILWIWMISHFAKLTVFQETNENYWQFQNLFKPTKKADDLSRDIIPDTNINDLESLLKGLTPESMSQHPVPKKSVKRPYFQKYGKKHTSSTGNKQELNAYKLRLSHTESLSKKMVKQPKYIEEIAPSSLTFTSILPLSDHIYPQMNITPSIATRNESLNVCCKESPKFISITINSYYDTITINYPSYIMIPPLNVYNGTYIQQFISSYAYKDQLRLNKDCPNANMCSNPFLYVNKFASWKCNEIPHLCGDPRDSVIMANSELLEATEAVQKSCILRFFEVCNPDAAQNNMKKEVSSSSLNGTILFIYPPRQSDRSSITVNILIHMVQFERLLSLSDIHVYKQKMSHYEDYEIDLINRFGIPKENIHSIDMDTIESVYYSFKEVHRLCDIPTINPYLIQHALYMMKLPYFQTTSSPQYATYIRTSSSYNIKLSNEDTMIQNLKLFFDYKHIPFIVFDNEEFQLLSNVIDFWSSIKYVIGTHTPDMNYALFAPKGTIIIELLDEKSGLSSHLQRNNLNGYIVSMLNDMNYHSILCSSDNNHNLYTPFTSVKHVLDAYIE